MSNVSNVYITKHKDKYNTNYYTLGIARNKNYFPKDSTMLNSFDSYMISNQCVCDTLNKYANPNGEINKNMYNNVVKYIRNYKPTYIIN